MSTSFKYERIASEITKILNENIIEISDLDFVTVQKTEITKDLQDANIYVSSLTSSEAYVLKTLKSKEGFLKKKLAQNLNIRKIPALRFHYDHSMDNYNKIDEILKNDKQK